MRKFSLFLTSCLLAFFSFATLISCGEEVLELPSYTLSRVAMCERDSVKMNMLYSDRGLVTYRLFIHDNLVSQTYVNYSKPGIIECDINGVHYEIQLFNSKGGCRVESVLGTINGARYTFVKYVFDENNRLKIAQVDAEGESVYTNYKYEGSTVIVEEKGQYYRIELSNLDNIGNVCNVYDFAGAPKTSKYVINPDLYFLNIYGAPISKLPVLNEEDIKYTEDGRNLAQVGKYHYEY